MLYLPATPSKNTNPHIILTVPVEMPYLLSKQGRDTNRYNALTEDDDNDKESNGDQDANDARDDLQFQEQKEPTKTNALETKASTDRQFVQSKQTTRSGKASVMPARYANDVSLITSESMQFTQAKLSFMAASAEFGLVGAGLGGGFINTNKLHVMKYNEAMTTKDKPQ